MAKPRNHRLRDRIWRVNALLLVGVVWATWCLASEPDPVSSARDWDSVVAPDRRPARRSHRTKRPDEILRLVRHLQPTGDAIQAAGGIVVPPRLPLRAFEIAMVWHDDEQGYFVMLNSKDPAHDDKYFFEPGKPDRDAALVSVRTDASTLYASVRRGEESFEFKTPLRSGGLAQSSVFRLLTVPSTEQGVGVASSPPRPALKGVPYYKQGRIVGLRVTGVRPGSWAEEMGVERGDVIRSVDTKAVSDAFACKRRLRLAAPKTLEVTRTLGRTSEQVRLSSG